MIIRTDNDLIKINRKDYVTDKEYYEAIIKIKKLIIPKIKNDKENCIENILSK